MVSKLQQLVGSTVTEVVEHSREDGSIFSVVISFSDGTTVEFSPSSYNYGGQELNIEVN